MAETTVPEATQQSEEFREGGENGSLGRQFPGSSNREEQQPATPHVPTRNFYALLRNTMEVEERQDATGTGAGSQSASSQAGRPPPIILTSATNLIKLQKKIRGLVKANFEFRNTRSGARVVKGYG
jgi:hypothetical protein